MQSGKTYDVLVIGGGNAGLCAALAARERGASVLVLEAAPKSMRGGNSRHVRNLRCMHDAPEDVLLGSYSLSEYWDDLLQVTGGQTNEALARMMLQESGRCRQWMLQYGARFQPALGGTLQLSRTNAFFLGGGKSLLNAYYRAAETMGVHIQYDAEVCELDIRDGRFHAATVIQNGIEKQIRARSLVAAAGGFQGNIDWLREAWGTAADNFIIRGTPYDNGRILRSLMDAGIQTVADPIQCHAVAVDARSPRFDGGIVTRVDCVSLGIVVNRDAVRFYDEGEDFWPKGLSPAKTHWARKIDTPPFLAYPLRPGITFTYLGVAVNDRAQVVLQNEKPATNIFAAGEIMAGNILGKGYLAGIGMTIGTVFGRIAGREAACNVSN